MRKTHLLFALLGLALLLPAPASAQGFYIGGGFETVELGGEFSPISEDQGFALDFGFKTGPFFALDFMVGTSLHEENFTGVGVTYSYLTIGPKFFFPNPSPLRPYLTAGASWNDITFDTIYAEISGWGTFVGAGVEGWVGPGMTLGVDARWHDWTGDDGAFHYDGSSTVWSVLLNLHMM